MVSKASDDLPEPDTPVTTVIAPRGRSTSMPLRLCSLAPRTDSMFTLGILPFSGFPGAMGPLSLSRLEP